MVDLIADGCRLFPVEGKIPLVKDWPVLASKGANRGMEKTISGLQLGVGYRARERSICRGL
jgi:hypothetical protein